LLHGVLIEPELAQNHIRVLAESGNAAHEGIDAFYPDGRDERPKLPNRRVNVAPRVAPGQLRVIDEFAD
jgi:hypothetical protein